MNNLTTLLNASVNFPAKGTGWFPFIGSFVYGVIKWLSNHGLYFGLAIVLFTIILKLILLPIDFMQKYYTKRNANKMAEMKPDLDAVKAQYMGKPQELMMAQREVYRQHNYKMGGFMLFMLANLFIVCAVFFAVFGALRAIADTNYNVEAHVQEIHATYEEYQGTDEFNEKINEAFNNHIVDFLWIKNIWKQDVPWVSANITEGEYVYYSLTAEERESDAVVEIAKEQYAEIIGVVGDANRSWNGLFILVALAGLTSWASAVLSAKIMATKKKEEKKVEPKVVYSMRDTKNTADAQIPTVDPVVMGKIMKFILPAIMVWFTMMNTGALAIYIITNSVLSTLSTMGMNYPVDKLLAWQDKKAKANGKGDGKIDPNVINPHAKYFKKGVKK